eukprot:15438147-Alexandrium_andersonii.AAC.1
MPHLDWNRGTPGPNMLIPVLVDEVHGQRSYFVLGRDDGDARSERAERGDTRGTRSGKWPGILNAGG